MVVNKLKVIDLKLDLDENEIVLWSLSLALNGHTYYWQNHWFAHAGDCKKCKHELDSIVKAAVKEAMQCE